MISSVAIRSFLNGHGSTLVSKQVRLVSSLQSVTAQSTLEQWKQNRRLIHNSPIRESDATTTDATAATAAPVVAKAKTSSLLSRFSTTAEVTVSKIFPAGFGWQTASIIASSGLGYSTDSAAFALTTGAGDAIGVLLGHYTFYAAKKSLVDGTIDMTKELHTGILLGSAAFCSGTAWQPAVDMFQGANLSFGQVFAGTWMCCGAAFYVGLRVTRTILSGYLEHIQEPTFANSMHDKSLSMAIGGATGFFVGTDAAYLPDQNFLINIVGIQPGTPDIVGCAIAGSSTSLGFVSAQSAFNLVYPAKKLWND